MTVATIIETGGNTEISQYGFTWTIQGTGLTTGVYITGDAWVVGPVTFLDIQPASTTGGRIRNGTMLNFSNANKTKQGFDNVTQYVSFDAALNVSPNFTGSNLVVSEGSVISTTTYAAQQSAGQSQVENMGIVTVLTAPPAADSFRPYCHGTTKSSLAVLSDLDYTFLKTEVPPASTPALSTTEATFERPWVEQIENFQWQYVAPRNNMPNYGREVANEVGDALCQLNLNYSNAQKEELYLKVVQYGLEIYGAADDGMIWPANGGMDHGRKGALLLAGRALNNAAILAYADKETFFGFAEDRQTFHVSQADVDQPRYTADGRPRTPYEVEMIGTPEWGEIHSTRPEYDGSNWGAFYRQINYSSLISVAAGVRLMGLDGTWNWTPFFEYHERALQYALDNGIAPDPGTNSISQFQVDMWNISTTSPVLSNPVVISSALDTATLQCDTTSTEGRIFALVNTSGATPTEEQVMMDAGAWNGFTTTLASTTTLNATGLSGSTTYYAWFYQVNNDGGSTVLGSIPFVTGGDPAPLVLSNPTESAVSETTATVGCDVARESGTLYAYIGTSATPPSTTDIKNGTGAVWFGNDPTPTFTTTFPASGLTASTIYYTYFYQEDGGDTSNVLESGQWNTIVGGGVGHLANITIDSAQVPADQTDYIVYVNLADLDDIGIFWDTVAAGGGDIRCFKDDGVTELAREVVSCVPGAGTTGTGDLYIKFNGTLSSTVNTLIQIHADGVSPEPAPTDPNGRNAVWSDYACVMHIDTDFSDSTGNNTPAPNNITVSNQSVILTGSTDEYVNIASTSGFDVTNTYTVQFDADLDAITASPNQSRWLDAGNAWYYSRDNANQGVRHNNNTSVTGSGAGMYGGSRKRSDYSFITTQIDNRFDAVLAGATGQSTPVGTFSTIRFLAGLSGTVYSFKVANLAFDGDRVTTEFNNQTTGTFYTPEAVAGAPITLNNPTESAITETTATVGCDTDTTSGILYAYVSTSPTAPIIDNIKDGTGSVWFGNDPTPTATTTFNASGLTRNTTYYTYFYQEDGGDTSNVLGSGAWSTLVGTITLSNPTENAGRREAQVACDTDTIGGTMYGYVSTSATAPSVDDLKNGVGAIWSDQTTVTGTNTSFFAQPLDPGTTYYTYFYQEFQDGTSSILESGFWVTANDPVLSAPTEADITENSATVGCTADTLEGVLYAYVGTSATAPSIPDIIAGTGATWSGNQVVTTAINTFSATGLSAGTDYYTYFVQDVTDGFSNVLESGVWQTAAGPTAPILSNPQELNITQISATIRCNTDTTSGILYAYVGTVATPPSTDDLKNGVGAEWFGNDASPTSTTSFDVTGLAADKVHYSFFYQEAAQNSTILESGPWSTLEGLLPSSIAGVDVQECLFRTAGDSNLLFVGNAQLPDSNEVGVEVNAIRAVLTWNGTQYEGPATDIANYLATVTDTLQPVRFVYGEGFEGFE